MLALFEYLKQIPRPEAKSDVSDENQMSGEDRKIRVETRTLSRARQSMKLRNAYATLVEIKRYNLQRGKQLVIFKLSSLKRVRAID